MRKDLHSMRVKAVLKDIMKKKGFRYEDAARALKVSLPTMRRWLSRGELSLTHLSKFADWLDLDLFDLLLLAKTQTQSAKQFTEAQEKFFATNPIAIAVFRSIAKGVDPSELEVKLTQPRAHVQKMIRALERHDLVTTCADARVKVKTTGPFEWRKGGALEQTYLPKIVRATADHVLQRARSNKNEADILFTPFELWLTQKTQKQLFKELGEVIGRYSSISKIETAASSPGDVREVTGLLLGDNFSVWGKII